MFQIVRWCAIYKQIARLKTNAPNLGFHIDFDEDNTGGVGEINADDGDDDSEDADDDADDDAGDDADDCDDDSEDANYDADDNDVDDADDGDDW